MFCPQCGSTQSDDLKYCKSCGSNLQALRQIMATRDTGESMDWSKTWVAEMFMSNAEKDRRRGMTAEDKRRREIKAGVITASAGIGLALFLFVLMGGIIASGRVSDAAAEILSRLWIVGIIPIVVGAALVFNGMFISKRSDELPPASDSERDPQALQPPTASSFLSPANTNELESGTPFSVTDATTRHLQEVPRRKDS